MKHKLVLPRKVLVVVVLVVIGFLAAAAIIADDATQTKIVGGAALGLSLLLAAVPVLQWLHNAVWPKRGLTDKQVENARSELAQAQTHLDQHEYQEAIQKASSVLQKLPKKADAYRIRAQAYTNQGKLASALDDWNSAIRLEPGHPFGYSFRGMIYKEIGEHQKAIEDFETSLILAPDLSSGTLFQLSLGHFLIGQFAEAEPLFRRLLEHPHATGNEKEMAEEFLGRMPKA